MRIKLHFTLYVLVLWLIASAGCNGSFLQNGPPEKHAVVKGKQFLIVTTTSQDNLGSLAQTYLNSEDNAWKIARYNRIETVTPGRQIVIPLEPVTYGGLRGDGFQTVPILFYPHIAINPTAKESVASRDFLRQVTYLLENDFVTISLEQLNAFLNLSDELPPQAVMISFDTADRWVYDIAYPILLRYGMKAALFVPAEKIGKPGNMTWQQVNRMATHGVSIGAHGPDIRSFNNKDVDRATRSINQYIAQSTKRIAHHLKRPCRDFSTPFNDISDLTTAILKKQGYRTGLTRTSGQNPFFTHNFGIRRSIINGQDNLHQFSRNLITFQKARLQ